MAPAEILNNDIVYVTVRLGSLETIWSATHPLLLLDHLYKAPENYKTLFSFLDYLLRFIYLDYL